MLSRELLSSNFNAREFDSREIRIFENNCLTICWRPVEHFGQKMKEIKPTPSRTFLSTSESDILQENPNIAKFTKGKYQKQIRKISATIGLSLIHI